MTSAASFATLSEVAASNARPSRPILDLRRATSLAAASAEARASLMHVTVRARLPAACAAFMACLRSDRTSPLRALVASAYLPARSVSVSLPNATGMALFWVSHMSRHVLKLTTVASA